MSSAKDWYNKQKENSAKINKERIQEVLKADDWDLQTVLHLKLNCSALEDAEHHCVGKGETFGFNEKLVNRLMYLAYLYGCRDIEQKSFDSGYYSCRKDFAEDLNKLYEDYGVGNE